MTRKKRTKILIILDAIIPSIFIRFLQNFIHKKSKFSKKSKKKLKIKNVLNIQNVQKSLNFQLIKISHNFQYSQNLTKN